MSDNSRSRHGNSLNELILMPSGKGRGGAEEALLQYVSYRARQGAPPHVISLEPGSLQPAIEARGAAVTLVDAGRLRELGTWIGTIRRIATIAKREHSQIILSWMTKGHLYGAPAGALAGVPAIYYQMGLPDNGAVDRASRLLPAPGALGCSAFVAHEQHRVVHHPVLSVPLAVDIERFEKARSLSSADLKRRLGFDPGRPLIGIAGRLQRWKGMHTFAEAMAKVTLVCPDCQGVIIGGAHDLEPEYARWLEQRVEQLGLSGKVRLAGKQNNIPEWMQAMDIFVHASEREPFGIVVVEAMSLGKPVVATKPGGPEEVIEHRENGLLVPPNDASSLANAILNYLSDPGFAARIGSAARKRALEFNPERFGHGVLEALKRFAKSS
jgi:glycosyltransferase involved in cell wall biosynthesis